MRFQKSVKHLLFTGILSCFTFLTFGQGVYLKLGGGYNFGIGSATNANVTRSVTIDPQTNASIVSERMQRVKINYGKGFSGNVAAGYMLNDQLGAEIEVGYLAGGKNESRFQATYNTASNAMFIREYKSYARLLLVQPSIIFCSNINESFKVYGKFGIVTAKGTIFTNAYILDQDQGSQERIIEARYEGGWGFGLMGGIGFSYKLNEKCDLFSEIKMNNLSYSPKWYRLKKETLNGEDITAIRQKDTELVNSYSTSYSGEPAVNIKETFPFSSVGLNVGIKYNF